MYGLTVWGLRCEVTKLKAEVFHHGSIKPAFGGLQPVAGESRVLKRLDEALHSLPKEGVFAPATRLTKHCLLYHVLSQLFSAFDAVPQNTRCT